MQVDFAQKGIFWAPALISKSWPHFIDKAASVESLHNVLTMEITSSMDLNQVFPLPNCILRVCDKNQGWLWEKLNALFHCIYALESVMGVSFHDFIQCSTYISHQNKFFSSIHLKNRSWTQQHFFFFLGCCAHQFEGISKTRKQLRALACMFFMSDLLSS